MLTVCVLNVSAKTFEIIKGWVNFLIELNK